MLWCQCWVTRRYLAHFSFVLANPFRQLAGGQLQRQGDISRRPVIFHHCSIASSLNSGDKRRLIRFYWFISVTSIFCCYINRLLRCLGLMIHYASGLRNLPTRESQSSKASNRICVCNCLGGLKKPCIF